MYSLNLVWTNMSPAQKELIPVRVTLHLLLRLEKHHVSTVSDRLHRRINGEKCPELQVRPGEESRCVFLKPSCVCGLMKLMTR